MSEELSPWNRLSGGLNPFSTLHAECFNQSAVMPQSTCSQVGDSCIIWCQGFFVKK